MLKAMEAILARRFAPFYFSDIPGFPNNVPTVDEWGDYLPRFKGDDHDHPAQHLINFHQYMDQLDIHHEDVLLKMFMYSLEGDARQWYRSLPISSISSLKDFHVVFHSYCKRIYPAKLLLDDCCEQIKSLSTNDWKNFSDEIHEDICQKNEAQDGFDSFQDVSCNLSGDHHEEFAAANPCEDQFFIKETFVVNHLEDHTAYIHKSSSLSLDMYQSSPVYDEYDDDLEILDPKVHDVKQFDQQFHEGIESIVREESELVYDNYSSESEPSSDKHISISSCIGGDINKLVCNYHNA
jgi:hypothetical protein